MCISVNQIGYRPQDVKTAVLNAGSRPVIETFALIDCLSGEAVYEGPLAHAEEVAGWNRGYFSKIDFTPFTCEGRFYLKAGEAVSYPFEIRAWVLDFQMMMNTVYYFRSQRDVGEWEAQDKNVPFQDLRPERIDASGGWFDATGDYGIHLSHLTHSQYYTPQQTPLSAYVFYKAQEITREWSERWRGEAADVPPEFFSHLLTEGAYGADHLMRRAAPSGSFYRSIRRGMREFGPQDRTRHIGYELRRSSAQFGDAFTAGEEQVTQEFYEVALRMGGGLAIAALATAARHPYPSQQFTCEAYLHTATRSYDYLLRNNERYANDGRWNLLDRYAALIAATEIYNTTRDPDRYRMAAQMMEQVIRHTAPAGDRRLRWNVEGDIPYCHAAEAGLPVVSLMTFYEADPTTEAAKKALETAEMAMRHEVSLTDGAANPFGYPRYLWKEPDGRLRARFFFPHRTTASPWWQGENARLGSLSAAALYVADHTGDRALEKRLRRYAQQCVDWIMGLNPFDVCMISGCGHRGARYFAGGAYRLQAPGGIVNGITSHPTDEEGIAFIFDPDPDRGDNWRWGEQWIPHASWYLYAIAMKYHASGGRPAQQGGDWGVPKTEQK